MFPAVASGIVAEAGAGTGNGVREGDSGTESAVHGWLVGSVSEPINAGLLHQYAQRSGYVDEALLCPLQDASQLPQENTFNKPPDSHVITVSVLLARKYRCHATMKTRPL